LRAAQAEKERPSLILVRTHIGYGSPHKEDTFEAHGSPLGEKELKLTKQALGWPLDPLFYIPDKALAHFRLAVENGQQAEAEWMQDSRNTRKHFPGLAKEFQRAMSGELPKGWDTGIPVFPADAKGMATRVASGKVMNAISKKLPTLIGGSADLDPSTKTALEAMGDFENPQRRGRQLAGIGRRRLELCRTQPALWCSRTCDGIHCEWVGGAWRHHSIHGDVLHFLGLHAAADPTGRADGTGGDLRFHPR
jgi:transketolase